MFFKKFRGGIREEKKRIFGRLSEKDGDEYSKELENAERVLRMENERRKTTSEVLKNVALAAGTIVAVGAAYLLDRRDEIPRNRNSLDCSKRLLK